MDIKNIFGKVQELRNAKFDDDDDDILDSAVSSDDYEDAKGPQKFSSGIFEDENDTPVTPLTSFSYSPTAALPDFDSDSNNFAPLKGFDEAPASTASTTKFYDLNSVKPRSGAKFKLTFISLHDIYDAKNVANLMVDKNAIVVVNLSLLSEDQSKRAMDFLDGAKYVTKSVFARFTEHICAFIPADIELHGDFYNQVEL